MKFLQELVTFKRIDNENADEDQSADEFNAEDDLLSEPEFDGGASLDDDTGEDLAPEDDFIGDEEPMDGEAAGDAQAGDEDMMGDEPPIDDEMAEPEDPDRAGLIRTVNKAHLVYKRTTDDGTFEEMWMYNMTNLRDEMSVRKAILSGTDIPPNKSQSPDGSQSYELWTAGNAEMMLIKGLPQ